MSSVETRNELKNYLELAQLAGDSTINDKFSSSKGAIVTQYKRANPMISNEDHRQQPQRLTNGFEAARKQNNNSQLQALNNANALMMPALQGLGSGIRNNNTRTAIGQQYESQVLTKNSTKQSQIGVYSNKSKREMPYQQEPYRIVSNFQAPGTSGKLGPQTGGNPKFLPHRQSPGALKQSSSKQQYSDSLPSNFTSVGSNADNHLQSYLGQQKLPAKFINTKQSIQGKAHQPVRARTNLEQYEEMALNQNSFSSNSKHGTLASLQTQTTKNTVQQSQQSGKTKKLQLQHQESAPGPEAAYHTIAGLGSSSVTHITSLEKSVYNKNGSNGASSSSMNVVTQHGNVSKPSQPAEKASSNIQIVISPPISNRKKSTTKLAKQLMKPSDEVQYQNNGISAKTTIEPEKAQKINKQKLHQQSKIVIESLTINNTINTLPKNTDCAPSTTSSVAQFNTANNINNNDNRSNQNQKQQLQQNNKPHADAAQVVNFSSKQQKQQMSFPDIAHSNKDKSYVVLLASKKQSLQQSRAQLANNPVGKLSQRASENVHDGSQKFESRLKKRDTGTSNETEQQRRASHQPLNILPGRVSSHMAYRCYSRQKESRGITSAARQASRQSGVTMGSRQRTGVNSSGQGVGEGDLPLPRALSKQPAQDKQLIILQQDNVQSSQKQQARLVQLVTSEGRQRQSRQQRRDESKKTNEDPFETERQLIIDRGGSLTGKVNHVINENEEDLFNDRAGFRIKINKEQKVVNHLEDRVENNNLLFYNFNAYKQDGATLYEGCESNNDNYGTNINQEKNIENQQQQNQQRPYSRGTSQMSKSRQDFRQRQIQSAASVASIKQEAGVVVGRRINHSRQKIAANHQTVESTNNKNNNIEQISQQLYNDDQNLKSCTSLIQQNLSLEQHQHAQQQQQLITMNNTESQLHDRRSSYNSANGAIDEELPTKYINNPQRSKAGSYNRYRQQVSSASLHLEQQLMLQQHSHSAHRQVEIPSTSSANLAVNVTSSGSLTTAATTKGSDFGLTAAGANNFKSQSNTAANAGGGSNTPQLESISKILPEVQMPSRPTNTSRVFNDQSSSGSMRQHRGQRGVDIQDSNNNSYGKGNQQVSVIQASQTSSSMGQNSFARSAMRLKQKSSRNGIPHRGGSLDGVSNQLSSSSQHQPEQQKASGGGTSFMSKAGRTGAVWSRMLNMQSVEEGIQEGNISSEDD